MEFVNLRRQYKNIQREIDIAVARVLQSGEFIGGKEVEKFEEAFAKFCASRYAVSCNSGTDALALSLKALGIGRGDEVITTPFSFIATAEAIAQSGAKPVFVDIEEDSFTIAVSLIEQAITRKTKGIMPVHLFGYPADMRAIMRIAKKHKLFVIEDAAQAVGAKCQLSTTKWQMSGSIGDLGCFSFFPIKNLGAYGDGGIVVTNSTEWAETMRLLKNHGSSLRQKYSHFMLGKNSRLDTLQAAILQVKLKHLKAWNRTRVQKASYWSDRLRVIKEVTIPQVASGRTHVFHQYTIRVPQRDKLQAFLRKKGIPSMVYYPLPLHLQPALRFLRYKRGDFPKAERAAQEVLSLPMYPELSKKEQDTVIESIQKFYVSRR